MHKLMFPLAMVGAYQRTDLPAVLNFIDDVCAAVDAGDL